MKARSNFNCWLVLRQYSVIISKILIILLGLFSIQSCTSHHTAAPVLTLSTTTAKPQSLTEITTDEYIVKPGDTLFSIAFYSGNGYRELAAWNKIPEPYTIRPGEVLKLRPINKPPQTSKKTVVKRQDAPKLQDIRLDASEQQAYRESQQEEKSQTIQPKSSKIPNKKRLWIWPASGERTVATVGVDGSIRGIEIKGKKGAPVRAAADGKVVYAGNALKGYGNLIIIKHDDVYLSAYAHNETILVKEQSYVNKGQQIATMGDSDASAVKLHFEIRKRGKSMDPLAYLP